MIYTEDKINAAIDFFRKNIDIDNNVIGLSGHLGAGKTTFVKSLLKSMGVEQNVVSPTFVLRRDYDAGLASLNQHIIHIDAYRLENPEHIYQVVSKEELEDKNNLIIIEWPELVDRNIFDKIFLFEHITDTERKIGLVV